MLGHAFGFQDRTSLVEGVESIGGFEEVVGQKVGTEFVEDERHGLAELQEFFGEGQFGGFGEDNLLRWSEFCAEFAEDGADTDVGVLDRKSVV